jgi:hypothetical protein
MGQVISKSAVKLQIYKTRNQEQVTAVLHLRAIGDLYFVCSSNGHELIVAHNDATTGDGSGRRNNGRVREAEHACIWINAI